MIEVGTKKRYVPCWRVCHLGSNRAESSYIPDGHQNVHYTWTSLLQRLDTYTSIWFHCAEVRHPIRFTEHEWVQSPASSGFMGQQPTDIIIIVPQHFYMRRHPNGNKISENTHCGKNQNARSTSAFLETSPIKSSLPVTNSINLSNH